ncbi:innexin inx3-like [Vespa mandarinia]|uniref:innexin inx3-like n=1 Tax=Vespa mandarinia TaxID=7446 RepID=UPI00160AE0FE|nr:innexin inx3-like [Vespa mandarinia]XP_035727501.1 innexin inx3-like [Vespa mandarinia]XP_046828183.1 innexin inx3 [Vespa crabro]XP_046828184.1 innexin inx3 [Vespa crabro]XP_046828185.1 innexin inx3 [Vespa crabro]XP_046828186.1 innexin inx3 [Vespa crabro]XP_046828187.1 innexin inx3 [Vespa crabro]XP_046828188.1 innexin inx3 [Vespa crabro]XP_047367729.1 innexin inx3 [Vespa velutina]XP_047367730.1 innexin inx3 [Vespa velutina]XP_047367731.1 innexin inx3 [Vespa velutina]
MAVFGLVSAVAGFVKVRYLIDRAIIDNIIFRAHYRITSAILFACCIIVTANNLIGDPINCIADNAVPTHVINTYCWITYTFTLPTNNMKQVGTQVAHPGLGGDYNEEKRYHSYYQWVPFMLFFQGILFYVPHWMWKQWEEGKVRMISDGMRGAIVDSKQEREARTNKLVEYILDTLNLHNSYAAGYFFCEALNFVNVVGNMFFIDTFLGGAFLTYGTEVITFSNMNQEQRSDPMVERFPRVTKCTFHKFGASGTIQKLDALCVLALNILNEKIYIFLWFWFIILAVMSGLAVLYSMAIVLLPSTRETILRKRFKFGSASDVSTLIRKTQVGDFLLIHLLGQNINTMLFTDVLKELCRRFHIGSGSSASPTSVPSAPSTLEMSPIYPEIEKYAKDTEI